MQSHAVIVPTYNERENIGFLVEAIFRAVPKSSVLVVDDSSPDGTAGVVRKLAERHPSLTLLLRKGKEGLGKAYVAGFRHALADPAVSVITMMDADFSHSPDVLPRMRELSGSYDLVIGSRYVKGGGVSRRWSLRRKLLSRAANYYLQVIFRYPVRDWTAGFMTIRAEILKGIPLDELHPRGYAFVSSLKYLLLRKGARVFETPIFFEERSKGASKMSFGIIAESVLAPWKMVWTGRRKGFSGGGRPLSSRGTQESP